jgi:hypothetical protein
MPIRFRCESCKQLLGIARRKAGTLVNCPTCRRALLVPMEDQEPAPAPAPQPAAAPGPSPQGALFERDDFDALLRPPPSLAVDAPPRHNGHSPVPAPPRTAPPPNYSAQGPSWQPASESQPAPSPVGLVLSPARATILTVVVILCLAVAFGAGLLVGRFYL